MLTDMIDELIYASDKKAKEKAYRALEKVGVDRITARIMASQRVNDLKIVKNGKTDEKNV